MNVEYAVVNLAKDLSEVVHTARLEQGISQTELAQRSNTSQRFVSEFEHGKQTAEVGKVLQLLHALGLRIAVTSAHTAEESRRIAWDGIERISREIAENRQVRPQKKLADYLAEA